MSCGYRKISSLSCRSADARYIIWKETLFIHQAEVQNQQAKVRWVSRQSSDTLVNQTQVINVLRQCFVQIAQRVGKLRHHGRCSLRPAYKTKLYHWCIQSELDSVMNNNAEQLPGPWITDDGQEMSTDKWYCYYGKTEFWYHDEKCKFLWPFPASIVLLTRLAYNIVQK